MQLPLPLHLQFSDILALSVYYIIVVTANAAHNNFAITLGFNKQWLKLTYRSQINCNGTIMHEVAPVIGQGNKGFLGGASNINAVFWTLQRSILKFHPLFRWVVDKEALGYGREMTVNSKLRELTTVRNVVRSTGTK
jgi:hypothetical protein